MTGGFSVAIVTEVSQLTIHICEGLAIDNVWNCFTKSMRLSELERSAEMEANAKRRLRPSYKISTVWVLVTYFKSTDSGVKERSVDVLQ
jgi:hypothetical protein